MQHLGPLTRSPHSCSFRRNTRGLEEGHFIANINVTYADLDGVASALSASQGELDDKLMTLKGLVDDLISQGFQTDKASAAFGSAYDEFATGAKQTISGIEQMCAFLKRTSENFTSADDGLAAQL